MLSETVQKLNTFFLRARSSGLTIQEDLQMPCTIDRVRLNLIQAGSVIGQFLSTAYGNPLADQN